MIYGVGLILLGLTCDPTLAALFTPLRPLGGRYDVCVTDGDRPDGYHYGEPEGVEPLDAFGTAGSFDRAKLAQLYGGRRVTVVRGWRQDGNLFESVTLLSPYPNNDLSELRQGTMIIRWITERP